MKKTAKTYMVCKPASVNEVVLIARSRQFSLETVRIAETIELSDAEYQRFYDNPLNGSYPYLAGKGDYVSDGEDNIRQVIAFTCPDRTTLLVDPSGFDYGRYVGLILEKDMDVAEIEPLMNNLEGDAKILHARIEQGIQCYNRARKNGADNPLAPFISWMDETENLLYSIQSAVNLLRQNHKS